MGCDSCKSAEKHMESIPYAAHESITARNERTIKRLIITIIVLVIAFLANNAIWINAWCQYDYTSEEVIVDSSDGGNANYIGQDGDIHNG